MSRDLYEYSIVSVPADPAFVGYNYLPGNISEPNWCIFFYNEGDIDPEQVLLDRFRDLIMEVEGIQPVYEELTAPQEAPETFDIPEDILELLEQVREAQGEPFSTITHPQYGPVWIAPQTHTTPPEPAPGQPHIYIGDPPQRNIIQGENGGYTVEGNGFRISTLGDGTWEASR